MTPQTNPLRPAAIVAAQLAPAMKNQPLRSHVLNLLWLLLLACLAALAVVPVHAAPMIAVFDGDSTLAEDQRVNNGTAYDFSYTGTTTNARVQTFTIQNIGDADLTGLAVSRDGGTAPDDFSVGNLGTNTLAPGASTTFTVIISPAGAGRRSTVVSIASNDASTPSFAIPVTGTGIVLTFANGKLTGAQDFRGVDAAGVRYRASFSFTGGSGTANPDSIVKNLNLGTRINGDNYFGWVALSSIAQQVLVGDYRQKPSLISGCDSDDFLDMIWVGQRVGVTISGHLFHRSIQNPGGTVSDTLGARNAWTIPKSDITNHLHAPGELYPLLAHLGGNADLLVFEGVGTGGRELVDNGPAPNLGTPDPNGAVTTQTFTVQWAADPIAFLASPLPTDLAVSVHGLNPDKYTVNTSTLVTPLALNATTIFTVTAQPGPYSGVIEIAHYPSNIFRLNVGFPVITSPTVTAISPDSGSTEGGESVTITGTNFTGATAVTIGGVAATSVVIANNTNLTAITPAHAAGVVDVVVTTPGGSGTGTNLYTYIGFPAGTDKMIPIKAGATYTFSPDDWGFNDGDSPADAFTRVKLTTVPATGTLKVDGVEAMAGQFVPVQRGAAGETWTPRGIEGTWTSIASSADGNKLAVAGIGYPIQISTNCGVTWTEREREYHWTSIASSADGSKLAAVTRLNYIYTSTDSGETWTPRETPRYWESIASSADGTKLAAVVGSGNIFTSTNCGVDWTERTDTGPHDWVDIASSADGSKLAAVATAFNIITSTNSGETWMEQADSGALNWTSIASSADGSKLAAVVRGGFIYTSTNCGVDWTERETERNWASITSSDDGSRLAAVVDGGQIYISTDCGETWTAHESSRDWTSIASSADGGKLAGAVYRGRIYTSAGLVPLITYTAPADGPASFTFQVEDSGATNNLDPSPNTITFLVEPNTPPVGTDKTNTIYAGETFYFSPEDWGFTDSDSPPNAFARVKLTTLPDGGTLKVEGVDAMAGQFVSMLRGPAGEDWDDADVNYRSWRSVASSADGTKLAAVEDGRGSGGYIYTSTNCGVTWTRQEVAGNNHTWRSIASSADGSKLAAVEDGYGNDGNIYTPPTAGRRGRGRKTQVNADGAPSRPRRMAPSSPPWTVMRATFTPPPTPGRRGQGGRKQVIVIGSPSRPPRMAPDSPSSIMAAGSTPPPTPG